MAYEAIRYELADGIATITLNRPAVHNAMNERMREELTACFGELLRSEDARVVVVTGTGERAFSAGADIREFVAPQVPVKFRDGRRRVDFRAAMDRCPQPIIAAIRGFALGGGLELALACDIIVAAATAKFGQPEINLGIIPGFGGTQRLPRRIGLGAARLLIYGGEMIDSGEAARLGLVDRVVPAADLMTTARQLAATFAAKAPVALQQAKAAINVGTDIDLEDGCRYEAEAFAVTFGTADRTEGMRAFLEKRAATFKGA